MPKSKHRKKKRQPSSSSSAKGAMMSFRSGTKKLVGGGSKSKKAKTPIQKLWDGVFWILLLVALGFFIYRRFL